MVSTGSLCIFLLLEFFTMMLGMSVMFMKINVVQILMHFLGVIACIFMILDRRNYFRMWIILIFFGIVPFVLEISTLFAARNKFRIINMIESEMRDAAKEQRQNKANLEKL
mmetsp:Transcript_18965/g.26253  ORF Transcript_18965/g.26253 Transcript_18965/m.26253 type:complete len:111 (+) Transcript_18965:167-499(+)